MKKIITQSQKRRYQYSVKNNRTGDSKYLTADTEYLAFLLILNCRRRHRIGKTGNRHQCSGTAPFSQFWINVQAGKKHTEEDQNQRSPGPSCLFIHSLPLTKVHNGLSQCTDKTSAYKGRRHIFCQIVNWGFLF